ncbi:hypothetical protein [Shewanella ulleungensis]|jgi:hypothetical protein|uniref:HNH endonuclease n=1 Tax=Shewanella ulleungensis TaxID=2282699 RepID=A0ABQ2QCY1_9GAMM|nr:hypothetical protein [Shewanella ulleungensis]MCL1149115.1 hypothetical protein [Shewanella ulleungensis]GGP73491.1 hypothetical protein GCM10009410_01360 [Shewanella ulleungensis]
MPTLIDIPFDQRHTCWFCAEPSNQIFTYYRMSHTPHPSLSVPACKECVGLAKKNPLTSIWDCRDAVKDQLMHLYRKDLAIGINWTEQELQESEFECKIFGGFKKSAWMMYQIAQGRINAKGWPLSIEGILLDGESSHYQSGFEFDGIAFTSLPKAIEHYCNTLSLDPGFLKQLVTLLGKAKFGHAIKIARLNIGITREHQRKIIDELIEDNDQA